MRLPSGEKAALMTILVWPCRGWSDWLSRSGERLPSGEKAAL
jgi:hypothetical protein